MQLQLQLTGKVKKQNQLKHMIQLDALRAIAVFGVLVYHWLPQQFFLNSTVGVGTLGVKLFFVLSGFLITLILLNTRENLEGNQRIWVNIRNFYIRRFLRILPIYYLTLFLTTIFFLGLHPSFIWHFAYLSNFYYAWHKWDINSPFWSLAIEFQFYLFWPLFVLFVPKKHLDKLIYSTIIIAPLLRILCLQMALNDGIRIHLLTPACFDSLGLGALLAFYNYNQNRSRSKSLLSNLGFWIGGSLSFALIITKNHIDPGLRLVVQDSINALFFVWVVDRAARGFGNITGSILEFKPLVYLGKISYGIYIYHSFVAGAVVLTILNYLGFSYPKSVGIQFVLNTVTTIVVAMLSWQYIEQPINNLKRHFKV